MENSALLAVLWVFVLYGQVPRQSVSLSLDCKPSNSTSSPSAFEVRSFSCRKSGAAVMLNFSLPFYDTSIEGLVVGGKNILFALDKDLAKIRMIDTVNLTARNACLEECRKCSVAARQLLARDHLCKSFINNTCPVYIGARCNNWYSNIANGGLDHVGNRLVVTCGSNYLNPECQFRQAKNISQVVLQYPARQSPSFERRLPEFLVYNSATTTIDASGDIIQPIYTAGYILFSQYTDYDSFGSSFALSIRRQHSAFHQPPLVDLYQDGDMQRRINQDITAYGEYVHQFERNGFVYMIMRDFGHTITEAYDMFSSIGQAYVVRYCKNDKGTFITMQTGNYSGFSSLMRAILVCRSNLIPQYSPKGAYFTYRYVTGATLVTINNKQFLFGAYNSYKGDPKGAAICAHPMDKVDSLFQYARNKALSSGCDIKKTFNSEPGVQTCSGAGPSRSYDTAASQSETFNSAFQYDLGTGRTQVTSPFWSEDEASLTGLASHTLGSTVYLYTAYKDQYVAVFSVDTGRLSADTKLRLLHKIPVSLPGNPLDVILDLAIIPQWDSEAVLTVATQYQVLKMPAVNCKALSSNCSVCVGVGSEFFDMNCGWCVETRACTRQANCQASVWIATSYDQQKSANSCLSLPATSQYSEQYPGRVLTPPTSVLSKVGSSASFDCVGQGSAPITITWTKVSSQKVIATSDNGRITVSRNGSASQMTISTVQAGDGGEYSCLVSNVLGNAGATAKLNLPPVVVQNPPNVVMFRGQSAKVRCVAAGYPTPMKVWLFNGTVLDKKAKAALGATETGDGDLLLVNANHRQEGTYSCLLINDHGTTSSLNGVVTVYDAPPPTRITIGVVLESDLNLMCNTTSLGSSYQWYLNNVVMVNQTSANLFISLVSVSTFGVYMCQGTASGGVVMTTIAYSVDVLAKPVVVRRPSNSTATLGTYTQFECEADAGVYPATTLSWQYGDGQSSAVLLQGAAALERDITVADNGKTLRLFRVAAERSGWYQCVLRNTAGSVAAPAYLTVTEPPKMVSCQPDMQINSTEDSVEFSCSGSGEEPLEIQFYRGDTLLQPSELYAFSNSQPSAGEIVSYVTIKRESTFAFGEYKCRLRSGNSINAANCSWVLWSEDYVLTMSGTAAPLKSSDGDGVSTMIFVIALVASMLVGVIVAMAIVSLYTHKKRKRQNGATNPPADNGGTVMSNPAAETACHYEVTVVGNVDTSLSPQSLDSGRGRTGGTVMSNPAAETVCQYEEAAGSADTSLSPQSLDSGKSSSTTSNHKHRTPIGGSAAGVQDTTKTLSTTKSVCQYEEVTGGTVNTQRDARSSEFGRLESISSDNQSAIGISSHPSYSAQVSCASTSTTTALLPQQKDNPVA